MIVGHSKGDHELYQPCEGNAPVEHNRENDQQPNHHDQGMTKPEAPVCGETHKGSMCGWKD